MSDELKSEGPEISQRTYPEILDCLARAGKISEEEKDERLTNYIHFNENRADIERDYKGKWVAVLENTAEGNGKKLVAARDFDELTNAIARDDKADERAYSMAYIENIPA